MAFTIQVFVAVLVFSGVFSLPTPAIESNDVLGRSEEDSGWDAATKVFRNCDGRDMVSCVGAQAVGFLDRASRMASVDIFDGIKLIANVDRTGKAMTENEIEADIQTSSDGKAARLLDLIAESVSRFFRTHYMEFKMPEAVQESLGEGRKKIVKKLILKKLIKKFIPLVLLVKGLLATIGTKIGLMLLSLVSFKALLIAKIALGIGAYLLYRSRASASSSSSSGIASGWSAQTEAPHHHVQQATSGWSDSSYQAPATSWGTAGGPYQRSLGDAHQMAFAAQVPQHLKSE